MTVTGDTPVIGRTISDDGVRAKLAGTPLESWASTFVRLSNQYGIDPNWIVSYMQWETGFGGTVGDLHPSMLFNDPWDMLCGVPGGACGTPGPGAIECRRAPNDYCYYVYPTMEAGIEAGYANWKSYVDRGWSNYFSSLSVALCGNPAGCGGSWVANVIAQANDNAQRWPYAGPVGCQYDGECPPGQACAGGVCLATVEGSPAFAVVVGLGFLAGGAATWWLTKEGRPPLASLFRR